MLYISFHFHLCLITPAVFTSPNCPLVYIYIYIYNSVFPLVCVTVSVFAPCVIPAQIVESYMNLAIWILGFSVSLNKSVSSLFDCLQSLHFKFCKCMTVESIFDPTIRIKKTYNLWLFFFVRLLCIFNMNFMLRKKRNKYKQHTEFTPTLAIRRYDTLIP